MIFFCFFRKLCVAVLKMGPPQVIIFFGGRVKSNIWDSSETLWLCGDRKGKCTSVAIMPSNLQTVASDLAPSGSFRSSGSSSSSATESED